MTIPTVVTLAQLLAHLRLPAPGSPLSSDEIDLQMKLDAATQFVCEHINDRQPTDPIWTAEIESWGLTGSPVVAPPPLVVLAVLELASYYWRFRGDDEGTTQPMTLGYLPTTVTNILVRYRQPVLS
jgi:hypothetical protein